MARRDAAMTPLTPDRCDGCPLARHRIGFVGGEGDPATARLVVVGEAPGSEEIAHNPPRPFIGRSGAVLRKWLDPAVPTYITNVRKCLPPADESPDLRAASIAHCVDAYLTVERDALTASVHWHAVGGDAARVLTGLRSILDAQGATFTAEEATAMQAAAESAL